MAKRKIKDFYSAIGTTVSHAPSTDYALTGVTAMDRMLGIFMGVAALGLGIADFIPALSPNNHVLGLFLVNPAHTLVHFVAGGLSIYAATRLPIARNLFRGLAIFFGIMFFLGLIVGDGHVLGVANNMNDVWMHALKFGVFSYLGWRKTDRD